MAGGTRRYDDDVPDDVAARVRAACLALPDAYEEPAWVGTRWMVRKRTFAHVLSVALDDQEPFVVLSFRSAGDELEILRHAGHPFFVLGWGRDAMGMVLDDDTDWDEVAELATESFCVMAPKKLVALVDRPTGLDRMSPSAESEDRSHLERMLAGDPYIADGEIAEQQRYAQLLMHRINASAPDEGDDRRRLLHQLLGAYGEGSEIRPPLYVDFGYQTHVGDRTFVNFGLVALDVATITIGDDVQIGPNVQLLTPTHPTEPEPRRAKWGAAEPITIGDNVWLGGGVIVCPGVTIGANTVVGAGSVVVTDLPAGVVAVGIPARVVRTL